MPDPQPETRTGPVREQGLYLPHMTIADPELLHQVIFISPSAGSLKVSCNCLAYQKSLGGGISHAYMGDSESLDVARAMYNNPEFHIKPFGPEWRAKW